MDKNNKIFRGILTKEKNSVFIMDEKGIKLFEDKIIWDGYVFHWEGEKVCARVLPQKDYEKGEPIIIIWPDEPEPLEPFVELYFNERLVKYPASLFGHNAINVNGKIYNFSHLLNENEIMKPEEFFYRPALGEFAPSPGNNKFETMEDGRAYFDKFGRNFMRTIHVLRILGVDSKRLSSIYDNELEKIHATPVNPRKPEKYNDFNFFTRSCSTIIRDGLQQYGFNNIAGFLPWDFFVNTVYNLHEQKDEADIHLELYIKHQLFVQEAPKSTMTPLMNMKNRQRLNYLKNLGIL